MDMNRRSFIAGSFAAVAAVSTTGMLAACSKESVNDADKASDGIPQVVVALSTNAEPAAGFNPIINWGCGEHMHEPLIQSTLIRTTADLDFENDLATDYFVSDDGLTWTFTIRDDVRFSNEDPLTAEDVAFTINKIIEEPASECDLSMVESATAPDSVTVIIGMKEPCNALLYLLAVIGIVPQASYSPEYGSNPIGSGRYILEQWDKGQQAILRANDAYYGQAPLIKRLVVLFMSEDAALAAAKAGEVDVAYTNAVSAQQELDGYSVLSCDSVDSRGIALPVQPAGSTKEEAGATFAQGNDLTCNIELRRAINWGIDRQHFVDNVLNGFGSVAYSVGTGMPWYSTDMEVEEDRAIAQRFMEDAGWKRGGDGVFEKQGTRASMTLYYMSTDSIRQAIAEEFASQMKEIGIEVKPSGMIYDDMKAYMYSDPCVWGFGSNAPFEIKSLYHSAGGFNVAGYDNALVDSYIDEALAQPSLEDSFDYWKKAQWDGEGGIAPKGDAPWVWIANINHLFFVRDGLTVAEQKPHPHGHGWSIVNNVDQWSW